MTATLDTLIIGAGTAGLAALREVRRRTERFVIVNDGPWGTTCARVGCMPSKALIEAANAFHARTRLDTFGVRGASALSVDLPAVLQRVRELRDDFVAGTLRATADLGDARLDGRAVLLGPDTVEVNGQRYTTKSLVIATGTRPKVPQDWLALGERVLTTDTLFEQPDLGPRIAVIGMGVVGIELSQALARLGLEVVAFSSGQTVGGLREPELNAQMIETLKQEMVLHTGSEVQLREVAGGIEVTGGGQRVVVDQVLAAMGRTPNVEHMGLDTLGLPLDDKGLPPIDRHTLQVGELRVFMPGDANAQSPVLHEAADEGYIAGQNALASSPTAFVRRTPMGVVFCDPQIAFVGQRTHEIDPARLVRGSIDFDNQGRARTAQRNRGQLQVYADRSTGVLLGAEMFAPAAEHLAHLLALAIGQRMTVQALLGTPFYHPTLEEGLRTALRQAARSLPQAGASDLSVCEPFGACALD